MTKTEPTPNAGRLKRALMNTASLFAIDAASRYSVPAPAEVIV